MTEQEQVNKLVELIQKAKENANGRTHVDAISANIQSTQSHIPGTVDFAIRKILGENEQPRLNKTDEDLALYILNNCNNSALLNIAQEILKQVAAYDGPPAPPPKFGQDREFVG